MICGRKKRGSREISPL